MTPSKYLKSRLFAFYIATLMYGISHAAPLPPKAPSGDEHASPDVFTGVRVLKTKNAGDLDWSVELPSTCTRCRLELNEFTSTENPREFYFHFFMPGDLDRVAIQVKVDPKKVRGVLVGRAPVPFEKKGNAILLDVPTMQYPEGGAPALHTYIETPGVRTRIEHADEQRRYGRYASGHWPKLEAQAALNLEFAAREAITALGVDRLMQNRGLGVIQLMGFDTNYPTLAPDFAHVDYPPHWHMHVHWAGDPRPSYVIPHHYIGTDGLLTHNKVTGPESALKNGQKIGNFDRGQTHETLTPRGDVLFTHTITPEGYFSFGTPIASCLLTPVDGGFHTGVNMSCTNGVAAHDIKAEDDFAKGHLRLSIGGRLVEEYFYDPDTSALKSSKLMHEYYSHSYERKN